MKKLESKIVIPAGAVLCVLAGMLVGLPSLFASGSHDGAPHNSRLDLLTRAGRPSDALPEAARKVPFAQTHYPTGRGSRLAYDSGGERLYVIPGRNGQICLVRVSTDPVAPPTSGTCNPRSRLKDSAIVLKYPRDDGTSLVVGIASDGWRSVGYGSDVAAIHSNVFLIHGAVRNRVLRLRTGDGNSRRVKLPS